MANTRHHPILDYLRRVLGEPGGGVSDADLLRRFVDQRDEAAFELLLWRHAAMVLHVCRQVLDDEQSAEDAFQATFLVLVRKAGSVSRRESLGSWLYRVAHRIALKARARTKTRTAAPEELDRLAAPAETEDADRRELRRIVCEEVDRLPANYRAAVVACFFEGKTHEEAAKQLGWPRGTVAGRLARARELLRRRLLRRGVTLTLSALVSVLAVRTAQAALAGLVDSVIHTSRLLAAGQAAGAVVSPHVAALAEGVLHAMYWTKSKIAVVVLFLAGLGGAGVTLLATQELEKSTIQRKTTTMPPQPWQPPVAEMARGEPAQASDDEDEIAEDPPAEESPPEDAAKLAHDMARSRLNLKKLAIAMQNYADTYQGRLPLAATVGKNGKALLSWRVELLPYLGENALYNQFKRDEPWDSPHNKKLLSKMPAVFAPPGVKTRPYSTFYQVFVSVGPFAEGGAAGGGGAMPGMPPGMRPPGAPAGGGQPGGMPGMPQPQKRRMNRMPGMPGMGGGPGSGPGGAMPPPGRVVIDEVEHFATAFVKGEATRFPASIPDGTSNTILIVEAGNPVPWTKPEDLHYADDEPLPELGGLFPSVFHAAFADGSVHTLTKNYNKKHLRYAITANDGVPLDLAKIEARSRPRAGAGGDRATVENWQLKNAELRKELEQVREHVRLLREEQEVERELAGEDPRVNKLKEEHAHMQLELKKLRNEIDALKKDIRQPRKP
ncbi:MAG TPA: sigma-70 family RNA polymerase sigma factor [Gemmataceae bacterium]|nr:sigma-70 family RNA polymerase sigma factor [Gemmataceae bacterium]